ncbi:MAG: ferredoxin reductase [Mycobacteriaceae bacterium]
MRLGEAMATPHGVDRYLELVNPMSTVRQMRAEVTAVTRMTADSVTITLRPGWQWKGFTAGQYVQLGIVINGIRQTRCYSPANSQWAPDNRIEVTVARHRQGVVSQYLHEHAQPGLVVDLTPATGTFQLPEQRPEQILLISGGSGITPVISMLRTLIDENYSGQLSFVHYGRSRAAVPYLAQLQEIAQQHKNIRLVFAFTRAEDGDLQGHFNADHLAFMQAGNGNANTYLCGPPSLLKAVEHEYAQSGLSEQLHTEAFVSAPIVSNKSTTGQLSFSRSALKSRNNGKTLLEQAEDNGLTPEHGCRMGICFSCTSVKKTGCTQNILTGEIDPEPNKHIQLCISVPIGDIELDL